ncbi:MAG: hypothetical protein V1716_04780 [Candidatus Uhrbacteria bacterium]
MSNLNDDYLALEAKECPIPSEAEFGHVALKQRSADLAEAKSLKEEYKWDEGQNEAAKIFERFLMVEISRSLFFGDAEVVRTTRFDDYKNGVDLVLEWLDDNGDPVRLAVDLTSGASSDVLEKKRQKIGSLGQIRYFRSENTKAASISVPLVVLGIDANFLQEIAEFAEAHREIDKKTRQSFLPKQTFADHPLKYLLLEQAIVQLEKVLPEIVSIKTPFNNERIAKIRAVLAVLKKVNSEAQEKLKTDPRALRAFQLLRTISETHKKLAFLS